MSTLFLEYFQELFRFSQLHTKSHFLHEANVLSSLWVCNWNSDVIILDLLVSSITLQGCQTSHLNKIGTGESESLKAELIWVVKEVISDHFDVVVRRFLVWNGEHVALEGFVELELAPLVSDCKQILVNEIVWLTFLCVNWIFDCSIHDFAQI